MSDAPAELSRFSDGAWIVTCPSTEMVWRLFAALTRDSHPAILNLHPAYSTLLVEIDLARASSAEIHDWLSLRLAEKSTQEMPPTRDLEVPVRYGGEDGPDLPDVARHCGLSTDEVIRRHCDARYLVAFLGFAPGFPYLTGLPRELATPRLATPRLKVAAGSVGIAGGQTGIYPLSSSGGWRIIGRTSFPIFDATQSPPARFRPGDRVRFRVQQESR